MDAFLLAGSEPRLLSRTYNVGGPETLTLGEIARICSSAAGAPDPALRAFPEALKTIDIGSYYTDTARIARELGWKPAIRLADGIAPTLDYCRKRRTDKQSNPAAPVA